MRDIMYGSLEHDVDILYTKANTKYGLITVILDPSFKINFFEKSIANKTRAQVVIFKQSYLSDEFITSLTKDAIVLLAGELIKTPSFTRPSLLFSRDDIKELNSDCLLSIGDSSKITVFGIPKEKERKKLGLVWQTV